MRPSAARSLRLQRRRRCPPASIGRARPAPGSRPSSAPGDGGSCAPRRGCGSRRRPRSTLSSSSVLTGLSDWQWAERKVVKSCVPDQHAPRPRAIASTSSGAPICQTLPALERRRRAAVEDPVEIAPPGAREARMPVVGDRLDLEHRHRVGPHQRVEPLAQPVRGQRLGDIDMRRHRQRMDPGVGPPGAMDRRPPRRSSGRSPRSSAACTDRPIACRCQPTNGPPSYSTVSRQRVMRGSCPRELRKPRSNSSSVIGALPGALERGSGGCAPSPQAMVSRSSSTSPGAPPPSTTLGREQLDPLARQLEPGAGEGREARTCRSISRRRPRPVDPRLVLADLGGVGDALLGLRTQRQAFELRKHLDHQLARQFAQALPSVAPAFLSIDRQLRA